MEAQGQTVRGAGIREDLAKNDSVNEVRQNAWFKRQIQSHTFRTQTSHIFHSKNHNLTACLVWCRCITSKVLAVSRVSETSL